MTAIPAAAKPSVGEQNKGVGWLLSGLSLLATVPALVGIGTGDVPAMVRNHPIWTLVALGCVIGAVGCGFVAGYVVRRGAARERILLITGLGLMSIGLFAAVVSGVRTWRDQPEPSVTAKATLAAGATTLAVNAKGSGIRAKDELTVLVEPLVRRRGPNGGVEFLVMPPLLGASLGPTHSGDVDYATEVPVPPGAYTDVEVRAWIGDPPPHCYVQRSQSGCVTVHLGRAPERPQLTVDWKDPAHSAKGLSVTLGAHDIPGRALTLRVEGQAGKRAVPILRTSLAPDGTGALTRTISVPVDRTFSTVCVVASTSQASPACPARPDPATVWMSLRPPSGA